MSGFKKASKSGYAIAGIFGIVLLTIGILGIKRQIDVKNWLTTNGEIISARNVTSATESKTGTKVYQSCFVKYQYKVGLKDYIDAYPMRNECRHSEGDETEVYYDPGNPGDSTLERSESPIVYGLVLAGFLSLGLAFVIAYFEHKNTNPS